MDYKCICILLLQYNRNTNITHIVRKSIELIDRFFYINKMSFNWYDDNQLLKQAKDN